MLYCGTAVAPSKITREIQHFTSSTSTVRVATDAGDGFIKSIGNPMGTAALISELVGGELGTWLGLKVPPFAIVSDLEIEITMKKNGRLMVPPMFFSAAVDGTPRDGTDVFLSRLRDRSDIAKLVVFDTWIRNWDRYHEGESNSENLLFVRSSRHKYELVPIDHSNCFIGADPDFPEAAAPEHWVQDASVYGKFPEFDDFITSDAVNTALAKLSTLERPFVEQVVNAVPAEWGLSINARQSLVNYVCDRAVYVVDTLAAKLIDEPDLPGVFAL